MENWKAVPNFEGIYEVSDFGRVRRIAPWSDGRKTKPPKCFKPSTKPGKAPYQRVSLRKNGKTSYFSIHRLVLAAFVGLCPPYQAVNHKNGIHSDNRLENLEYMTAKENSLHAYRVLKVYISHGSKHCHAKLSEDDVFAMRALRKRNWTVTRIAKEFGMSIGTTSLILNNKSWKHI